MSDKEGMGYFPETNPPPPIERFVAPEDAQLIDERDNEIEHLRGILAFYASTVTYCTLPEDLGCPPVMRDGGELARKALGWE